MEAVRNVESALRAGDQQTEEGEGEGERERLARERRGRETKDELVNLERLGKVSPQLSGWLYGSILADGCTVVY